MVSAVILRPWHISLPQWHGPVPGDFPGELRALLSANPVSPHVLDQPYSAVTPSMRRPVKIRSLARFIPMSLDNRCVPPLSGTMARLVSGNHRGSLGRDANSQPSTRSQTASTATRRLLWMPRRASAIDDTLKSVAKLGHESGGLAWTHGGTLFKVGASERIPWGGRLRRDSVNAAPVFVFNVVRQS
jgi:hypothetical protein